jgi:hypothetical protein
MSDSASSPTITIVRGAGTAKEYRQAGIPADIKDGALIINSSTIKNLHKYDEIHADYLDEPCIVTAIRSRELSENQKIYEVEVTPLSIYRTTFIHGIKTAGKKEVPKDTITEIKLGDFPGTVNITIQCPGQKNRQDFAMYLFMTTY